VWLRFWCMIIWFIIKRNLLLRVLYWICKMGLISVPFLRLTFFLSLLFLFEGISYSLIVWFCCLINW
jgi:hypothetical protein